VSAEPPDHQLLTRLAAMRRSYELGGLDESQLASDWLVQFEHWLRDAERAGLEEANAMILATADVAAHPSARTVLLKGLDERGFVFFTGYESRKGRELAENPRAALVFPWYRLHRQVVVEGAVERVSPEESDGYWASRPYGSRLGAVASPQSQVVASRRVLDDASAELAARYPPGSDVPRPERWGGLRVVPDSIEFWQGRPDRLHDRLRFRHEGDRWVVERLAP
jgi:pyridoxamine 5'-phosphate oxidase